MRDSTPVDLLIPGLNDKLQLYVHGEQDLHVSRQIREQGIWEPYETSLLLSLLRPDDVFVDVGANLGYFSVLAASLVGEGGAVFAFEPDPANFELLQANAALNGVSDRVHAVQAGLAANTQEGCLYLSADNLGDHQTYATGAARQRVPVRLLNGSRYLEDKLLRLDMLKVDTQGSEYQVLAGLMPLLKALPQAPRIVVELTPGSLCQAGDSGRALIELLATLEQSLWIIDHIEHRLVASTVDELARWCDDVEAVSGDMGFMNILCGPAF